MTRRRAALAAIAALAVTGAALSGCTGSNSPSAAGGPTLAVYDGGSGAFTKNFNPLSPTVVHQVQGMLYEPLFFFNGQAEAGTKPVSMLGTRYSFDDTGTKLSVTTRSGVRWSDGTAFSAKDVAFTMNLINKTPALNTSGNAPTAEATDDTHVVMTFSRPSFTDGPNILGHTFIVPRHVFQSVENPATFTNPDPIGTGPMTLASFSSQSYLLKKNPKFWDAGKVEVGALRMYSLSGNEAAANKLISGGLDWTGIYVPNITKTLSTRPNVGYTQWGGSVITLATCSSTALGCTGPQTDPVVRQAMAAAIDRTQVNKLAYSGSGSAPSATFVAPSAKNYIASDYATPESMSAQAKKADSLLEGDGWAKGSDGVYAKGGQRLSLTALVISGYTDYISILQTVQEQFKTAGIELNVKQSAAQEVLSSSGLGSYQLVINSLAPGPTSDPYSHLQRLLQRTGDRQGRHVGEPLRQHRPVLRPGRRRGDRHRRRHRGRVGQGRGLRRHPEDHHEGPALHPRAVQRRLRGVLDEAGHGMADGEEPLRRRLVVVGARQRAGAAAPEGQMTGSIGEGCIPWRS